ncbi:MAG: tRNA (adenosine(37)-N6)-threonylcarbamoyltransferase complex ATPase subunit type 1 TsaE [Oscillospiraceae bacterium]
MRKFISNSEEETEAIACSFSASIRENDVVAYTGSMGMGKTAFTRGLVKGFGGDDVVSSPTFALVNEYETPRFPVYHFDMYRVTTWENLYSTGFFDYLENGSVLLIEWSENIEGALPETAIHVELAPGEDEHQRIITIEGR